MKEVIENKTTKTELKNFGHLAKGSKFSVKHNDGFVANETVSNIYEYVEETKTRFGRGFEQYIGIDKISTIIIVCESCSCYEPKEIHTN